MAPARYLTCICRQSLCTLIYRLVLVRFYNHFLEIVVKNTKRGFRYAQCYLNDPAMIYNTFVVCTTRINMRHL